MRREDSLNNKYRVLLTEVLPYELPLLFNNEAFYRNMLDENVRKSFFAAFNGQLKCGDWTIPFDYEIRRAGGEKSRRLSLIHPLSQLEIVEFYSTYDEYMINLCSHSPFSIRHIDKIARCVFPPDEDAEIPVDVAERPVELVEDEVETRYRSYFRYKKYDLAYKFFESVDNLRLEQKYRIMLTIDVSGCFYHIYTHSVTWAVKGKDIAKKYSCSTTFENGFDKVMQHANYNETNGIVVGPEVSRIFAEIILQAVDLSIMRQLKDKHGYRLGQEYEIRRYVDDSYVYATKREVLDNICQAYADQLAPFKMDINKSKLVFYERPFTTGVSDAKEALNAIVDEFRERYLTVGEDGFYTKKIRGGVSVFSGFVRKFRSITHQHGQDYGSVNKYALTLLLRQVRAEKSHVPSLELLIAYTEIAFYLFSLDMHTTASYRLCSLLDCLIQWSESNPDIAVKRELENQMRREAKRVLDIYMSETCNNSTNLEALNLILVMNRLIGLKVPLGQIDRLFGVEVKSGKYFDKLNYFQICTLLYVIENDKVYTDVKCRLEDEILRRLSSTEVLRESEMAHLFFDIITCPYVNKSVSLMVVKNCTGCKEVNVGKRRAELAKPGRWFFDWDKKHSLSSFLAKKEYHSPYE